VFQVLTAAQFRAGTCLADKLRWLHRITGKVIIGDPIAALKVVLAVMSVIQNKTIDGGVHLAAIRSPS